MIIYIYMESILVQIGTSITCPVAILIKDGKVLCGLRHYTPDKWKTVSVWTVPGGRCDEGETIERTLRREVEEEVGIADLEIIDFVGQVPGAKEGDHVYVFTATTSTEPVLMEPEKFSEWRWFKPAEIPFNFINEHLRQVILRLSY